MIKLFTYAANPPLALPNDVDEPKVLFGTVPNPRLIFAPKVEVAPKPAPRLDVEPNAG